METAAIRGVAGLDRQTTLCVFVDDGRGIDQTVRACHVIAADWVSSHFISQAVQLINRLDARFLESGVLANSVLQNEPPVLTTSGELLA